MDEDLEVLIESKKDLIKKRNAQSSVDNMLFFESQIKVIESKIKILKGEELND